MESGKLLGDMVSFWSACGGRSSEILQILQILSKPPPGFAQSAGSTARRKFSNDWKNFPMAGKFRPVFPIVGKNFRHFSNDWKKCFQWLETFPAEEFLDSIRLAVLPE
jgi:hypothetical protein